MNSLNQKSIGITETLNKSHPFIYANLLVFPILVATSLAYKEGEHDMLKYQNLMNHLQKSIYRKKKL